MSNSEQCLRRIEKYIYNEVQLLDEGNWRKWLDLFSEKGDYWIPIHHGDKEPWENLSILYEDRDTLEIRTMRYEHPQLHSQQPPSRTSHLVSNIVLLDTDDKKGAYFVRAQFTMMEYRQERRTHWAGTFIYELIDEESILKIRRKKVLLVDSDAILETIHLPF